MTFLEDFRTVMAEANAIVLQRDAEGRNAAVSVQDQFESTAFVLDLVRMKCQRAKSYLVAGNFAKFKEEMQDCINYSGFVIVFESPVGLWPPLGEDGKERVGEVFRQTPIKPGIGGPTE